MLIFATIIAVLCILNDWRMDKKNMYKPGNQIIFIEDFKTALSVIRAGTAGQIKLSANGFANITIGYKTYMNVSTSYITLYHKRPKSFR